MWYFSHISISLYGKILKMRVIIKIWICPTEVKKQAPRGVLQKSVLKNITKFTGKHLCWSLFLIKLDAWRPEACSFTKKRIQSKSFPVYFVFFLWTILLIEHLRWLHLEVHKIRWNSVLILPLHEFCFLIYFHKMFICNKIFNTKSILLRRNYY